LSVVGLFRGLVMASLLAGLVAGLVTFVARQATTVPLIHAAEVYERHAQGPVPGHSHAAVADGQHDRGHHHEAAQAWEPAEGLERTLYTLAADLLTAIAFALLLGAAMALRGARLDWRTGLVWGMAGFVVFSLAPALGLPPELPGTESAALPARQVWWLATVVLTGTGLALACFLPRPASILVAVLLVALPHLVGAPHPAAPGHATPDSLVRQFVVAALACNALFWLVLGAVSGLVQSRIAATVAT